MKLKEIKPEMAVKCANEDETKALWMWLFENGYVRSHEESDGFHNFMSCRNRFDCYFVIIPDEQSWGILNEENAKSMEKIKFSDLIIPELSAEEVLSICHEICEGKDCGDCMLQENCYFEKGTNIEKVVEICAQWKAEHEKKEPEVEWFWQGRIYEIKDHNRNNYYQIKDGTGFYNTGCESRESAEEYMANVLKEYCKSHEGDYVAVVEHVCRVKEQ